MSVTKTSKIKQHIAGLGIMIKLEFRYLTLLNVQYSVQFAYAFYNKFGKMFVTLKRKLALKISEISWLYIEQLHD